MAHDPMDLVIGGAETEKRNPEASMEHYRAGKAAEAKGDYPTFVGHMRRSISADPSNQNAMFDLAFRLDLMGEEDEAIALYERLAEAQPAPISALLNLAVMYEDLEDYSRSERVLKQVLDTDPNSRRARLFMKDVQDSRTMNVEEEADRDVASRRALYDTPVTDFDLSVRARTCLKKLNIRTLGDLLRVTESELMSYRNFGDTAIDEIKQMLASKNLRLGQGADDVHRSARRQVADSLKGSGKEVLLSKPVSDLQLSIRARKALQLLNIHTIGDLVSHTEAELMGVKNFGQTSLTEVKLRLTDMGLDLRQLEG